MEYHNLKVYRDNSINDRYFVIDKKEIYMLGTSVNSIGDKTSMIVKVNDIKVIDTINKMINEIMV